MNKPEHLLQTIEDLIAIRGEQISFSHEGVDYRLDLEAIRKQHSAAQAGKEEEEKKEEEDSFDPLAFLMDEVEGGNCPEADVTVDNQ